MMLLATFSMANLSSLIGIIALVFILSAVIYTIIYMLGRSIRSSHIENIGKEGYIDLLIAAGEIIIIVAMIGVFANGIPTKAIGIDFSNVKDPALVAAAGVTNDMNHIKIAEIYLNLLYSMANSFFKWITIINIITGILMSVKVNLIAVNFNPFTIYQPIQNVFNLLNSSIVVFQIITAVQMFLLKFFEKYALSLFVPMGIALRLFSPTKSFGYSLIAFSIVFYLFYPLFMVINFYILANNSFLNMDIKVDAANLPVCLSGDECASGRCDTTVILDSNNNRAKICSPCVYSGKKSPFGCCPQSVEKGDVCVLKDDADPMELINKKGGLNMGDLTEKSWTTVIKGLVSKLSDSPIVNFATNKVNFGIIGIALAAIYFAQSIVSALLVPIAGAMFYLSQFSMMAGAIRILIALSSNPIALLFFTLYMNSAFILYGELLPIIEFVLLVEFARTLTGSLGTPLDILDIVRVL